MYISFIMRSFSCPVFSFFFGLFSFRSHSLLLLGICGMLCLCAVCTHLSFAEEAIEWMQTFANFIRMLHWNRIFERKNVPVSQIRSLYFSLYLSSVCNDAVCVVRWAADLHKTQQTTNLDGSRHRDCRIVNASTSNQIFHLLRKYFLIVCLLKMCAIGDTFNCTA